MKANIVINPEVCKKKTGLYNSDITGERITNIIKSKSRIISPRLFA